MKKNKTEPTIRRPGQDCTSDPVDVSSYYLGRSGAEYFRYQNRRGEARGRVNARKFSPYVAEGMTVLDFGCGNGAMLRHLPAARRIGIEVNPVAIQAARSEGNIELYKNLRQVADGVVDLVVSNHALEHVRQPFGTLREMHRALRGGGTLVLCVPMDDWRTQQNPSMRDRNHHLYAWTPLSLRNLLVEAGFGVQSVGIHVHAWREGWLDWELGVPRWLFNSLCRIYCMVCRRRQIIAVARKP